MHLHSTVDLGKITIGHHLWWLVANTNLETSWAPVDELNGSLGLECSNSLVDILGHNITSVEQASGHIFAISWIALNHLVVGLEAGSRNLLYTVGLMRSLSSRDDGGVGDQREVDSWVGDQVGLELV
jgi:hypothetical protein